MHPSLPESPAKPWSTSVTIWFLCYSLAIIAYYFFYRSIISLMHAKLRQWSSWHWVPNTLGCQRSSPAKKNLASALAIKKKLQKVPCLTFLLFMSADKHWYWHRGCLLGSQLPELNYNLPITSTLELASIGNWMCQA